MIRYVLIGTLLFLGFIAGFAPASLLKIAVEQYSNFEIIDPRGTVWRGQGELLVTNVPLGTIEWGVQPTSILQGALSYQWALSQQSWHLDGHAGVNFSEVLIDVTGNLSAESVNEWLRIYDIHITGDFDIAPTKVVMQQTDGSLSHVEGQVRWSGGRVRYQLSGLLHEATLPAMTAYLQVNANAEAEAVVYADNLETPLMVAVQGANGFAKVGITKIFTKLLDNPWPGSDPDHAIVLEVEEQVF